MCKNIKIPTWEGLNLLDIEELKHIEKEYKKEQEFLKELKENQK